MKGSPDAMTGFSAQVRAVIIEREGFRCARCGDIGHHVHHRRPRGMGGSKAGFLNRPAAGVLLCVSCHMWVESHRADAKQQGWLVGPGERPAHVPVLYRGEWTRLDNQGYLSPVECAS